MATKLFLCILAGSSQIAACQMAGLFATLVRGHICIILYNIVDDGWHIYYYYMPYCNGVVDTTVIGEPI